MGKNVIWKKPEKDLVLAHNLFDCCFFDLEFPLKRFWTGPPGEILPAALEPISATDTLPRRIKCQLSELLSDAPGVYLQEWKQK